MSSLLLRDSSALTFAPSFCPVLCERCWAPKECWFPNCFTTEFFKPCWAFSPYSKAGTYLELFSLFHTNVLLFKTSLKSWLSHASALRKCVSFPLSFKVESDGALELTECCAAQLCVVQVGRDCGTWFLWGLNSVTEMFRYPVCSGKGWSPSGVFWAQQEEYFSSLLSGLPASVGAASIPVGYLKGEGQPRYISCSGKATTYLFQTLKERCYFYTCTALLECSDSVGP